MGLVMEQMRKMESVRIGLPASRSLMPWARNQATWPWANDRSDGASDALVADVPLDGLTDAFETFG